MNLPNDIVQLFELFNKHGFKLYIIGGAVRDYLLDRTIKDYDFATTATPNDMLEILNGYVVDSYQSKIGSIKIHLNKQVYEITTFRKECGVKDFRYPEKIEYVNELKEDVLRRDFTVNSLAYSIDEGIVDYLDGVNDLNNKVIRFINDTKLSIHIDPIRIIRALRFSLLLHFNISCNDLNILTDFAYLVKNLSKIKYDELFKLFEIAGCKEFILKHFDIYKEAYPELNNKLFINVLNSNLDETNLKYVLQYFIKDNLNLKKLDMKILYGLNNIDLNIDDLYHTKLLMIEYQKEIYTILNILESFGYNVNKLKDNINIVKKENHCLSISELDISYKDLQDLDINVKDYSKIFKYLLKCVLVDYKLNEKHKLIELLKKGDF